MRFRILLYMCLFLSLNSAAQSLYKVKLDSLCSADTPIILPIIRHNLDEYNKTLNFLARDYEVPRDKNAAKANILNTQHVFLNNAKVVDDIDRDLSEKNNNLLSIDDYLGRFIVRCHSTVSNSITYIDFGAPCFWRKEEKDPLDNKPAYRYYVGISFKEIFEGVNSFGEKLRPHNVFVTMEIDRKINITETNGQIPIWFARIFRIEFCPVGSCCRDIDYKLKISPCIIKTNTSTVNDILYYKSCFRRGDSILKIKDVSQLNWEINICQAWAFFSEASGDPDLLEKATKRKDEVENLIHNYSGNNNIFDFLYERLKNQANDMEDKYKHKDAYLMFSWAYNAKPNNRWLNARLAELKNKIDTISKIESAPDINQSIAGLVRLTRNGENGNPDVWYALASRYCTECNPLARNAFNKVHNLDHGNSDGYRLEGEYYENCIYPDYRKAAEAYALYVSFFSDSNDINLKKYNYRKNYCAGVSYFMDHKYKLAKEYFSEALNCKSAAEAHCYDIVCNSYLNPSDTTNIITLKAIKNMLVDNPENAMLNYWYGEIWQKSYKNKKKYLDSTIKYIRRAVKRDPSNYEWTMELAYKYQLKAMTSQKNRNKISSYSIAVALYEKMLNDNRLNANECHYRLAQCYYELSFLRRPDGNDKREIDISLANAKKNLDIVSVSNLYKNDSDFMKIYGYIFLAFKNYDSAVICFNKARQKDPETHFGLGIAIYQLSHDITKGEREIELSFENRISYELVNEKFGHWDVNREKKYKNLKNKYGYR
jgi:hypothetical protein